VRFARRRIRRARRRSTIATFGMQRRRSRWVACPGEDRSPDAHTLAGVRRPASAALRAGRASASLRCSGSTGTARRGFREPVGFPGKREEGNSRSCPRGNGAYLRRQEELGSRMYTEASCARKARAHTIRGIRSRPFGTRLIDLIGRTVAATICHSGPSPAFGRHRCRGSGAVAGGTSCQTAMREVFGGSRRTAGPRMRVASHRPADGSQVRTVAVVAVFGSFRRSPA